MIKLKSLLLILPIAVLAVGLTTGCGGGSTETTVIETVPMTEEEEATYEEETMGSAMDDESQN